MRNPSSNVMTVGVLVMRIECPNYFMKEKTKKSKGNVLDATLSDIESDLSNEYDDECGKYMAFIATIDEVIVKNSSDSKDSFDDKVLEKMTFQEVYDKLCIEYIESDKRLQN